MAAHDERPLTVSTQPRKLQSKILTSPQRDIVGRLLGLNTDQLDKIEVSDREGDLILLYHREVKESFDPTIANVRGVVIDVNSECIVCPGGRYIPTVMKDELNVTTSSSTESGDDGHQVINIIDNNGTAHSYDAQSVTITPFYSGVNLRCFMYKGVRYCSTYHRLNPEKHHSRWVDYHIPFTTMYNQAGGPSLDVLFPETIYPEGQDSPYIYKFYVYHESLNLTTLIRTSKKGFVKYDGYVVRNDPRTSDMNSSNTPVLPEPYNVQCRIVMTPTDYEKGGIIKESSMSIESANQYLKYGNQIYNVDYTNIPKDPRLTGGESVIISNVSGAAIHVKSKSYTFRESLGNDEPNRYMAFVQFTINSNIDVKNDVNAYDIITTTMPLVVVPDDAEIENRMKSGGLLSSCEILPREDLAKCAREDILRMTWYVWLVNATQYYQSMALLFLKRYKVDVNDLIDWVKSLIIQNKINTLDQNVYAERIVAQLILYVKRRAKKICDLQYKFDPNQRPNIKIVTAKLLHDSINESKAIYQLIRLMRKKTNTSSINITEPGYRPSPKGTDFPPLLAVKDVEEKKGTAKPMVLTLAMGDHPAERVKDQKRRWEVKRAPEREEEKNETKKNENENEINENENENEINKNENEINSSSEK